MIHIGCHLSSSKGFRLMGQTAVSIGANAFQFFLRNPRGGKAKEIDRKDADELALLMQKERITACLAHAPYTLNLCSKDLRVREFAHDVLSDDLHRLEMLPCSLYNLHPGSHVGQGKEEGTRLAAETIQATLSADTHAIILLETMAGQGSEIGSSFEELRDIIDRIDDKSRIGVCLDTCHTFCAGYDIRNDPDSVFTVFDRVIGLQRLRFVHLNDSKFPLNSHKDRHERLGYGEIGWEAIARLVRHDALRDIPLCLETPQESLAGYAQEINAVRTCLMV